MSGKIIGIDLGTTNSLVAVWENGESKLIKNAFGEYLTPSVVSIDETGTVLVGKAAKERLASHPEQTASVFKRFMGVGKQYALGKKKYLPEELSALVLKKLKEDAERYLGEPVEEAVISVPAYFSDMARNATKRAGKIAGLKIERIINEPSAAALACQNIHPEEDATILVYDFGGGTLDVSLVECFDNVIEIMAVNGDNQLGGHDFDERIADYFLEQNGIEKKEISQESWELVKKCAEKCKWDLTENRSAVMVVNCQQINKELEITRKDVVNVCAELFERMGRPIKQVLFDSKVPVDEIDHVVLVGGSCKMPIVRQYLKHLLSRDDLETKEPDYMIALGCGIYAGIKERDEDIKDMLLTDICPFSLGISTRNPKNPELDLMSFIIPRNSPLPVSREETYCTVRDGQEQIYVKVFQGEAMYAEENMQIGELILDVPKRRAGEVICQIRFTYDINGLLEVNAYVPMTGKKNQLVIANKELGMTEEQIRKKLEEYKKIKINPAKEDENKYILAWGSRLYMQCGAEVQEEIGKRMQYFETVMKENPYQLPKVRKYLTVFFAYIEKMLESYVNWEEKKWEDGEWYQDDDEDEKEIDELFKDWDDKDKK